MQNILSNKHILRCHLIFDIKSLLIKCQNGILSHVSIPIYNLPRTLSYIWHLPLRTSVDKDIITININYFLGTLSFVKTIYFQL